MSARGVLGAAAGRNRTVGVDKEPAIRWAGVLLRPFAFSFAVFYRSRVKCRDDTGTMSRR